jgi:copper resistance protein C
MKKIIGLVASSLLVLSSAAFAHSGLHSSMPANEAMLMATPKALELGFTGEVRLLKLKLSTAKGGNVKFDFKPSAKGADSYSYPLPELEVGNYKVEWMAMGGDAHKMTGNFSFMVHGNEMSMMKQTKSKAKDNHSEHQH